MEENKKNNNVGKIVLKILLIVSAVIGVIVGFNFVNKGFDVKDNYYHSEYSSILDKHAYVGGDAYNYIINANYFTGYIVLGSSLFICSSISLATGLLIDSKK